MKRWLPLLLLLGFLPILGLRLETPPTLPFTETTAVLSDDGRWLALSAQRGGLPGRLFGRRDEWPGEAAWSDVYRVELASGRWENVTPGANGSSYEPSLSADGRRLAFVSEASNLVPQDNNACQDVFWWEAGRLRRYVSPEDTPGHCPTGWPGLSADGRLLSLTTYGAGHLQKRLMVCDLGLGLSSDPWAPGAERPSPTFGPAAFGAGHYLAFSRQVEVYGAYGRQVNAEIWGGELLRDRAGQWTLTGRNRLSSTPDGASPDGPSFSPCLGENVCVYVSAACNLVQDDANPGWDVFLYDRTARRTERVSQAADGDSFEPAVSRDGRWVAFTTYGALVPEDMNGFSDVYMRDRVAKTTLWISRGLDGPSYRPSLSGDGRKLAFVTRAGGGQVFLWEGGQLTKITLAR